MPKLVILGTSYAVPDQAHENTHMALVGDKSMVVIDAPGNPYVRLARAGLDPHATTDIIMTHFHPDHVSGIPPLLMGIGLSGHKDPVTLYGLDHCMDIMLPLLEAYDWQSWHFYPITVKRIPEKELTPVLENEDFRIFASPVKHFIPTIGLRVEFVKTGKVLAYSCDTAPTPALKGLAHDADVFIHEAAGASVGHSSAGEAGEMAKAANAKALYLIHYPTGGFNYVALAGEAAAKFGGPVKIAEDLMELEF